MYNLNLLRAWAWTAFESKLMIVGKGERNVSNPIYLERCTASMECPIVEIFNKQYRLVFYVDFEARLQKYFLRVKPILQPMFQKITMCVNVQCFLLKIWVVGPYLLV